MQNKANLSESKQALLNKWVKTGTPRRDAIVRRPGSPGEAVPLSFAQQRLWFLDQFEPDNPFYNISVAMRASGRLNLDAFHRTVNEIVRRHEALRTTFAVSNGRPVQVIAPELRLDLPMTDLSSLSNRDHEAKVKTLIQEEARMPFSLTSGPLIRVRLFKLSVTEHVIAFTVHHIVSDGWSMGVIVNEVAALYAAYLAGLPSPLPELAIQYADYACWQHERLNGEPLQKQKTYWKKQLDAAPTLLTLPTDRPRPAMQTYHGAIRSLEMPATMLADLNRLGRQTQTTLFMILMAAFNVLLSRYAAQDDICIGAPIANRNRAEVEPLIGFFVNTLVLRTKVDARQSFMELLNRVRGTTLDAYANQDVPFEQLVELLKPERHTSHSPLFQAMLAVQNMPMNELMLPYLNLKRMTGDHVVAKFDLTVTVEEGDEGFAAHFEYNTDLFDESTIARMAGHFRRLLEAIVRAPDTRIAELDMLGEGERNQLLRDFNDTAVPYPAGHTLVSLFEAQVAKTPEAVAVVYEGRSLSYAELNERANRLAHYLKAQGAGIDTLVGICTERSLEMIVGLYGILKAGAAYVPLDPSYPAERLVYMLDDAAPAVLLTQSHLLDALSDVLGGVTMPVLCLDKAEESLGSLLAVNPSPAATPASLAYVIYTSGSTGKPKGVGVPHAGIVNRLQWMQDAYRLTSTDRVLQKTPFSFDVSVWEFFWPLLEGAILVVAKPGGHQDPSYLASTIRDQRITTLHFVPPMLEAFLASADLQSCVSLRQVMCSGQALPYELQQRFLAMLPGVTLHNLYGPTEASVDVTAWECKSDSSLTCVPIGKPIANIRIHLLDEHLNPVPIGVAGELHIAGIGLARGYINRPELTAEKFIPDPFAKEPGERLYKTGDLARYLPYGNIEYLGRIDHQVKIRGFRIELGEIEAALGSFDGIREAVVLAREDNPGDQRLVGYLTLAPGKEIDADEIKSALLKRLPDYMVPAHFMVLEQLPLNPSGKVDRKVLPAPDVSRSQRDYVAPRNDTEARLAAIWAEVLKVERIGIHDNFFELGGHSLLAVTLIDKMRRAGLATDVRALFAGATIAAVAEAVGRDAGRVEVPPNRIPEHCSQITPDLLPLVRLNQSEIDRIVAQVPGGAANVQDIYPLAPLQQGILFHHLMNSQGDAYLMPILLRFDGEERLQRFIGTLQHVIDRHDVLRTAVYWEGLAEPVQAVWRHAQVAIETVSLDEQDGSIVEQLQRRYDPRHWRTDVRQAPLLRGFIAQDGESWLLQLMLHHLISDHTTLELIIGEVMAIEQGQSLPPALPFRNFVAQARLGISEAEHEAFFRQMLGDVESPTAPYGLLEVQGDGSGIKEASLQLEASLSRRLREQARKLGVSVASLVHLAWARVVGTLSGKPDVVFGTVLFGRMDGGEGADRVLGMFMNTLPIRIRLGRQGVRDSVQQVHWLLTDLLRHEHAPLTLAQRCSGIPAQLPLFSSLLNYRHTAMHADSPAWKGLELLSIEERTNYPIFMSVDDLGEGFSLTAQVVDRLDAVRVCGYLHTMLTQLIDALESAPQTALNRLELLGAEEKRQLLVEWNATGQAYPANLTVSRLFEAQAARTPGRVAVAFEGQQLTYRELNERANRLAHYLRDRGIGADALVGICVERSLEMMIGLLGILKAGGAYVPLDPAYPTERLAYMIADAKPGMLLTQDALRGWLSHDGMGQFCLDSQWHELNGYAGDNLAATALPDHMAYVIYTSGSTGRPKGVGVRHGALTNFLCTMQRTPGMTADDRLLSVTSLSFDIAGLELFLPLTVGALSVIVSRETAANPQQLVQRLQDEQITMMQATPSTWRMLVDHDGYRQVQPLTVLCGGEALPLPLAQQMLERGDSVWNLYGPTETTIWSMVQAVTHTQAGITIGRPIGNTQIYLLDEDLNPVPVGVAGELHIGGDGLARGYLHRPELTAERFIPNPFGRAGERLYKTGDLARYLPDGQIEYLSRLDHQVKIRGFRIELGEIEAALHAIDGVREAIVLAREDVPGDKRLAAYLTLHENHVVDTAGLRAGLTERLPDYMVPSVFMVLKQMPLTPNGKIDRKALPAPDASIAQKEYVAPRNDAEATLAAIWSEVLKVVRVGINDNFFELGGHSLLATQVAAKLRQALQIELPLRTLFEAPTLEKLAQRIADMKRQGKDAALPPLVAVDRNQSLPLSYAQQRLWLLHQLEPDSAYYNMFNTVRLSGPLDEAALSRSLNELVRRHEVLRTRFDAPDGIPAQVIMPAHDLAIPIVDLAELPADERDAQVQRLTQEEAQAPFDLATGPLVRTRLLRLAAQDHILCLAVHHIASDGWSMGLVASEISTLYASYAQGQGSTLPELPIQYADYAHWQRKWLQGEVLQQQLAYWQRQLKGAPALLALPTDRPRPAVQSFRGSARGILLPPELTASLQRLAGQHNATLFMALLAVLDTLLLRWSGQRDIVVGTVIAGRTHAALESLVGCFMNFLPLRLQCTPQESFGDLLDRLSPMVLDAYAHQDAPFEKITEALNPVRSASHNPIFNVGFLLQNFAAVDPYGDGLVAQAVGVEQQTATLDLRFVAQETPDGLHLLCEYATDLFDEATIVALLDAYQTIAASVVAQPHATIDEIALPETLASRQRGAAEASLHLVIAASYTAEPIEASLSYWARELGLAASIEFAPYNQIYQSLLDPQGAFAANRDGLNVVLLRVEDWLRYAEEAATEQAWHELLQRNAADLIDAAAVAARRCAVPLLIVFSPPSSGLDADRRDAITQLHTTMTTQLGAMAGVYVALPDELERLYPVVGYEDVHADEMGHIPYTDELYAALGTLIVRKLAALRNRPYKVIVLDCDHTLWQGVCGEAGPHGIAITPEHRALQEFMVRQYEAGMLLCLASKNDEADVQAVLVQRPDMVLKAEHLVGMKVNWQPKSANLKALARELQLGLDSFIFIDDNPVECSEVQAHCAGVLVLQLPDELERIPAWLDHVWAFDKLMVTDDARGRTRQYRENRAREEVRSSTASFDEFLASLQLQVNIEPLQDKQLERVAELTQRTNQFNLRPQPRLAPELQALAERCLTVTIQDRFGDYGLTGVVVYEIRGPVLVVETFLLSCRVLGRGVEYRAMQRLGQLAHQSGCSLIELPYRETGKNRPVLDFLQSVAFRDKQDERSGRFTLQAEQALAMKPQANGQAEKTEQARGDDATEDAGNFVSAAQLSRIAQQWNGMAQLMQAMAGQGMRRRVSHTEYVEPRNDTEAALAAIWAEVLKVEQVGIHDNFFELGGHSLLATQIMSRVRDTFDIELPLRTMFEASTVETMADRIDRTGSRSSASGGWIPLEDNLSFLAAKEETSRNILLIPGAGGGADVFHKLAQTLRENANVYVMHHDGVDNESVPTSSIREMAEKFAPQLMSHGGGELVIAGYSMGGIVGHEVAEVLCRDGVRVTALVLLDTTLPLKRIVSEEGEEILADVTTSMEYEYRKCEFFKAICEAHAVEKKEYPAALFAGLPEEECIEFSLSVMGLSSPEEEASWKLLLSKRLKAEIAHISAVFGHVTMQLARFSDPDVPVRPALENVPLVIVQSTEVGNLSIMHHLNWTMFGFLAPEVEVVDGPHIGLLREHNDRIAEVLLRQFESRELAPDPATRSIASQEEEGHDGLITIE